MLYVKLKKNFCTIKTYVTADRHNKANPSLGLQFSANLSDNQKLLPN